jgi:hypothetical protein
MFIYFYHSFIIYFLRKNVNGDAVKKERFFGFFVINLVEYIDRCSYL